MRERERAEKQIDSQRERVDDDEDDVFMYVGIA